MDDRRSCADDSTSSAVNRNFEQRFDNGINFSASLQNRFSRSNRTASGGGFSSRAYRGNNNSNSPGSRVSTVHFENAESKFPVRGYQKSENGFVSPVPNNSAYSESSKNKLSENFSLWQSFLAFRKQGVEDIRNFNVDNDPPSSTGTFGNFARRVNLSVDVCRSPGCSSLCSDFSKYPVFLQTGLANGKYLPPTHCPRCLEQRALQNAQFSDPSDVKAVCHVELSHTAEISPLRSALSACDDVKSDLTADISVLRSTLAAQHASFMSETAALREELDGHTSCLRIVHDLFREESGHKYRTFNFVFNILSEYVTDYDGQLQPFLADITNKTEYN